MSGPTTPDDHLAICADYLERGLSGHDVLTAIASALQYLITAKGEGQLVGLEAATRVTGLIMAIAPRVAEAAAGRLAPEHIYFGLGCASALLGCSNDRRRFALIAYVALLRSELLSLTLRDFLTASSERDIATMIARNPAAPVQHLTDLPTLN